MENDKIVTIGQSVIQHGYFNNRIYLIKIHPDDLALIDNRLNNLQAIFRYQKIIMKIPQYLEHVFKTRITVEEARIPKFYPDDVDALFLSRFFDSTRTQDDALNQIKTLIHTSREKLQSPSKKKKPGEFIIRRATVDDIFCICEIYKNSFETYPFPICEPQYLKKVINEGIEFFVGVVSDKIIAVGSCEIDRYAKAVEISDLAVDKEYQGLGLSKHLLSYMELLMRDDGVKTSYTICRARPLPVNHLFAGAGYGFGGTLIKNTNICGKIESMNVWYKKLS